MEESWLGRSYLDLDSESDLSLYQTRDSRLRQPSLQGSSLRTSEWGPGSLASKGLISQRKSRVQTFISGIPVVRLYLLIALIVIIILGAIGGGIAGGLVARRNNSSRSALR